MNERLHIQSLGGSMNAEESLEIARPLVCLGIALIEAGFRVGAAADWRRGRATEAVDEY